MSERIPLPDGSGKYSEGPDSELLSPRLIRRQFLLDTLQDRRVILPLAVCAMGLIYLLLYAPVIGGGLIAGIVAVVAGLYGAASLAWRAGIRYRQGYTHKLQALTAEFEAEHALRLETHLREQASSLERGFREIRAPEGAKILHALEDEYRQLQPVINRGAEADLLASTNLAGLVQETYIQGLNALEHALELERAIGGDANAQLETELKNLEKKAAAAAQDPQDGESLRLIQEKIDSCKERLSIVKKLHLRVEQLLHQADRCAASLNKTRIELAALKADASDQSVITVITSLQKTIERAKEVQAELRKLGY